MDPRFATDGHKFVYLYYTRKTNGGCSTAPGPPSNPVNRVSRFLMREDGTIAGSTEDVLLNNIMFTKGNHNGGDLHFGKDGNLYVSVGDGGCDYAGPTRCQYENDASRDKNVLNGKILRIEPDGSIPADNPFTGPGSERCNRKGKTERGKNCRETYLKGFRNPFRFAVDPDADETVLRVNDVGGQRWEEIDQARVGTADDGNDFGWNLCEGRHDNPFRSGSVDCTGSTYAGPIHEYSHGKTGCESITGGAFVPDGFWPAGYDRAYLFGDFVCGRIFSLTPRDGGGYKRQVFEGGMGERSAVTMAFGPFGDDEKALYYASFENGGVIRRIAYKAPAAEVAMAKDGQGNPQPNYGDANTDEPGLQMNFDASGSTDSSNGTSLTYLWDFGDETTRTTEAPTVGHTYDQRGKYPVELTVTDTQNGAEDAATIDVFPGDTPPDPDISDPADEALFAVDQKITANGSATDPDGDQIQGLKWEVLRHHDGNHAHPWHSKACDGVAACDSAEFAAPQPEGLYSTKPAENYLEVRLTATDSLGLSRTTAIRLRSNTVDLTFQTEPLDLRLKANGKAFRAPRPLLSWVGYELNVSAFRQRDADGRLWGFDSWSDGGSATHTIRSPEDPATYTATFRRIRN